MSPARANWALAWPLILSNLSVPLLGMVDLAAIGRFGTTAELAAVGLGANLVSAVYFLLGFLRTGTTALAARAVGARDPDEAAAVLARSLGLALLAGLLLAAASPLLVLAAEALLRPEPEVAGPLRDYVAIRLLGAPAVLAGFAGVGWCLGSQDARRPLLLAIVTNLSNAALTVLLVAGFGLGVRGAAIASVLAELLAAALLRPLLLPLFHRSGAGRPSVARLLDRARVAALFRINRDLFLRGLLLEAAFLTFAAASSRQGQLVLAANAVLKTFFTLSAYGLDGFAHATEALIGKAVGARDPAAVRAAVAAGLGNGVFVAVTMTIAFLLLGDGLVRLLTDLEEVRAAAGRQLVLAGLLPLVSVWAFLFDGVFFGAARARELRDSMALALALFLLLLPLQAGFGNTGLWLAFLGFLAARGAALALLWRRLGAERFAAAGGRP